MKQFGLVKPSSGSKKTEPEKKVASLFEEADDDLPNEQKQTQKQNHVASTSCGDQFAEEVKAQALKEDPNVYDYDAALEAEEETLARQRLHRNSRLPAAIRQSSTTVEKAQGPQYMSNLLARAEERKIESELVRLRNAKKRANADAAEGEETFVTSAYKEKLRELEQKEAELKALQAGEDDGDVSKRPDMSGFYFNLMKRNVSFGGAVHSKKPKSSFEIETENAIKAEIATAESESKAKVATAESKPDFKLAKLDADSLSESDQSEEEISFGPVRPSK